MIIAGQASASIVDSPGDSAGDAMSWTADISWSVAARGSGRAGSNWIAAHTRQTLKLPTGTGSVGFRGGSAPGLVLRPTAKLIEDQRA